jgi:hypothetical protein
MRKKNLQTSGIMEKKTSLSKKEMLISVWLGLTIAVSLL